MSGEARYPSLLDRGVLITGGGSGIGAAIVQHFARQGARVGFIDLAEQESLELVRSLGGSQAAQVRFAQADLRDLDALGWAIRSLRQDLGPFSVLVNNAARDDRHTVAQVTPAFWEDSFATNLRHYFFATQALITDMRALGGGSIINLGSISWHVAFPEIPLYATAKGAITAMTRVLAREFGADCVRVNCVVPGAVATERQLELWRTPELDRQILDRQCLKRMIEPGHVAAMVAFLAADDSALCTGREFFIDAGWF